MTNEHVDFRDATAGDASDLAILADAAGRRIISWMWDAEADPGQSSFDVGRTALRSDVESTAHYTHWRVAELDGQVVGGLNSHLMSPKTSPGAGSDNEVIRPLRKLKAMAADTWYISVAAVFPELRGQGIGRAILTEAERVAVEAGVHRLSLIVVSANRGALRLYERFGYSEWERRKFRPFPGSDLEGDWILMAKDL